MESEKGIIHYYYFCFVKHGWEPSKFYNMSLRDRLVIECFIEKYHEDRAEELEKLKQS